MYISYFNYSNSINAHNDDFFNLDSSTFSVCECSKENKVK